MENLLVQIICGLVDNPQDVTVTEVKGGDTKIFEIRANKKDIGQIIGKRGRTIDSIRTIFTAMSAKTKTRLILEIVD